MNNLINYLVDYYYKQQKMNTNTDQYENQHNVRFQTTVKEWEERVRVLEDKLFMSESLREENVSFSPVLS